MTPKENNFLPGAQSDLQLVPYALCTYMISTIRRLHVFLLFYFGVKTTHYNISKPAEDDPTVEVQPLVDNSPSSQIFRVQRIVLSVFFHQVFINGMAVPYYSPIVVQSGYSVLRIELQDNCCGDTAFHY